MIRLPRQRPSFPRSETAAPRENAWGSQWKHLRQPATLVRNAMRDTLRTLRG